MQNKTLDGNTSNEQLGNNGEDERQTAESTTENMLGNKIRELRNLRGLSLRKLSERSGLNINTLSLVENGKTSPSVSTLQQLAHALDVPITAFFETEPASLRVVYTSHYQRPGATFGITQMQNLGKDLAGNAVQPFVVTLVPGAGSGERMIVHTGHEFVYCLSGKVLYLIEEKAYLLEPGDSLVFESHLPHRWQNICECESQLILVIIPADQREAPGGRHFPID
jgi:transcriptional regulator with XRE-family HTH domain